MIMLIKLLELIFFDNEKFENSVRKDFAESMIDSDEDELVKFQIETLDDLIESFKLLEIKGELPEGVKTIKLKAIEKKKKVNARAKLLLEFIENDFFNGAKFETNVREDFIQTIEKIYYKEVINIGQHYHQL